MPSPRPGAAVPEFDLVNQHGEPVTSRSLGDRAYCLVFYPFAFSRVCTAELRELASEHARFAAAGVRLFGVSVDHKYALRAYADQERLPFELLADFWPHGAAAQAFGCFDPQAGRAGRSTYLVAGGRIITAFSSEAGQARSLGEYRRALLELDGDEGVGRLVRRKGL
ncbi:redoxin domain-containing protein [Zhihengliuella sp.]|uniref:redoxin domain-containing protein n=1 Tax=Zhihengliuella sp. TaxID=1954483 RepID=UPI002811374B|nr:redoxin domain-containing protein [Zhihengliuella sp.]